METFATTPCNSAISTNVFIGNSPFVNWGLICFILPDDNGILSFIDSYGMVMTLFCC
jgi:hypothetical protein